MSYASVPNSVHAHTYFVFQHPFFSSGQWAMQSLWTWLVFCFSQALLIRILIISMRLRGANNTAPLPSSCLKHHQASESFFSLPLPCCLLPSSLECAFILPGGKMYGFANQGGALGKLLSKFTQVFGWTAERCLLLVALTHVHTCSPWVTVCAQLQGCFPLATIWQAPKKSWRCRNKQSFSWLTGFLSWFVWKGDNITIFFFIWWPL